MDDKSVDILVYCVCRQILLSHVNEYNFLTHEESANWTYESN